MHSSIHTKRDITLIREVYIHDNMYRERYALYMNILRGTLSIIHRGI